MKKTSNIWIRFINITGISVLIIELVLSIFVSFFLKDIINLRLKAQIKETFGDFYTLSYEISYTSLSWNGFDIEFEKVDFKTDTSNRYMMLRYPAIFFKTNLFQITDMDVTDFFFKSIVDVNNVSIDQPKLQFYIPEKADSSFKTETDYQEKQKSTIDSKRVGKFKLSRGRASVVFKKNLKDTLYAIKKVNMEMTDLKIGLNSTEIIIKTSRVSQVAFSLSDIQLSPSNSEYRFKIEGMLFDYQANLWQAYGIEVTPKGDPYQMAKDTEFRKTIFTVKMDSFLYQSAHFEDLKDLKMLKGNALHLIGLDMNLVRNKSVPLDESKYKKLFHQSLLDVNFPVEIDSIYIKNSSIDYKLYSNKEQSPGNLMLTKLDATMNNLYNTTLEERTVTASFKGQFMEAAPFTFEAKMPLLDPTNHSYQGYIGSMDLVSLSPLIANLTRVKLTEGRINSIYFNGKA